jgi:phospholipid/cholesterol/gamma-HCH transport system substrate-binding protein
MTPYRRNIVVGITMLGALVILAWMILQFGEAPAKWFAPPMVPVRLVTERADGIAEGSIISYRGVSVGRVTKVTMGDDLIHVNMEAQVDERQPLPANVEGVIRSQVFGGSGILSLQLVGPTPQGRLKAHDTIPARFVGLDFIPPEFATLATELQLTARQFRESNLVAHLDQQVQKVGKILDSVDTLVSDPKMRDDLKGAVANMRSAAETATRVGAKLEQTTGQISDTINDARGTLGKVNTSVDQLSKQTTARMEELSKTLQNLDSITAKIDQGKGTAGALVNDPKLYQSLVDTSRELNATITDLKRLVEQWEQEGISFKLK